MAEPLNACSLAARVDACESGLGAAVEGLHGQMGAAHFFDDVLSPGTGLTQTDTPRFLRRSKCRHAMAEGSEQKMCVPEVLAEPQALKLLRNEHASSSLCVCRASLYTIVFQTTVTPFAAGRGLGIRLKLLTHKT